jgi:hypothetical protein
LAVEAIRIEQRPATPLAVTDVVPAARMQSLGPPCAPSSLVTVR